MQCSPAQQIDASSGRRHLPLIPALSADMVQRMRVQRQERQGDFWRRFGVTQSSGSRIESGGEIPDPVAILLRLYAAGIVTDEHLDAVAPLR